MPDCAPDKRITVAILAVGGQGGGVLSNWLVALAEANGWHAQNTSVPGVAQRTGATIYYIEMLPETERDPVLALMPSPGEVDVCVAAELMEAGRAIQRGLVSPDRTFLIASSHRAYALSEKSVPGDGTMDSNAVLALAQSMAHSFVHADMASIAHATGSVISAALFGAIAGSGALPFTREAFETTIEQGGVGVVASLAAFAAGFDAVNADSSKPSETPHDSSRRRLRGGSETERRRYEAVCERVQTQFPDAVRALVQTGLDAVIDFQDAAYGNEYLDHLAALAGMDTSDKGYELTLTGAKYLARAMAYDDVIRVAELKTRTSRMQRVRRDVGAGEAQIMRVTEFMHPRLEEVCGTLPAWLGSAIERNGSLSRLLRRLVDRGRRVRTDTLWWFSLLSMVAGMRRWRRSSLRHQREHQRID
ncbi:MAG: indolepyruvate oxidoreductase subunit beta family protein, partial [Gammaproteobacteria bacterium]|nr:indolepyruvate oxidoreductase subunit beta family protein [Gammaproteobacteria bacterium]